MQWILIASFELAPQIDGSANTQALSLASDQPFERIDISL
jgi:hypothetical protein